MQVYKSHLVEGRQPAGPAVDSARQNLAATFVNAFVNAGFGQDKLVTGGSHHVLLDGSVRKHCCTDSGSRRYVSAM